ncbi:RebB family R body protein [Marinomonas sp.]|uniref:RebB family R body protein n=1 Tax=Marinomonas sp. TaxID=1904862 RepID=UPI003BA9BF08
MDNDLKSQNSNENEPSKNNYSLEVVDTIFADTLSRGMQNAIVSQQNSQMASSSSVTNACARILQAQANKSGPITMPKERSSYPPIAQSNKSDTCKKGKEEKESTNVKRKPVNRSKMLFLVGIGALLISLTALGFILFWATDSFGRL